MKLKKTLEGDRVCVRNYMKSDLKFSTDMWQDEENGRYLSDPTWEYVNESYKKALDELQDSNEGYYFIVELKATKEPVGTCCIFPDESHNIYDIGYCIHKHYWKQGYGTETLKLVINWVREQGGKEITAEVADENAASSALMKKCGFNAVRETNFKKYNMNISFKAHIYQLTL